jgi:hypothetical protein
LSADSSYSDLRVECRATACRIHIEFLSEPELNGKHKTAVMADRPFYRAALGFGRVLWGFTEPKVPGDPFIAELYLFGDKQELATAMANNPLRSF